MNFSTMGKTQIHMYLGVKKVISLQKKRSQFLKNLMHFCKPERHALTWSEKSDFPLILLQDQRIPFRLQKCIKFFKNFRNAKYAS